MLQHYETEIVWDMGDRFALALLFANHGAAASSRGRSLVDILMFHDLLRGGDVGQLAITRNQGGISRCGCSF